MNLLDSILKFINFFFSFTNLNLLGCPESLFVFYYNIKGHIFWTKKNFQKLIISLRLRSVLQMLIRWVKWISFSLCLYQAVWNITIVILNEFSLFAIARTAMCRSVSITAFIWFSSIPIGLPEWGLSWKEKFPERNFLN